MVTEGHFFHSLSVRALETSHSISEEKFRLTGLRSFFLAAIGWLQGKLKNFCVSAGAMGLLTAIQFFSINWDSKSIPCGYWVASS